MIRIQMSRAALAALLAFVLVQGGFAVFVAVGGRPTPGKPSVDFGAYYVAAVAVSEGLDPYTLDDATARTLAAGRHVRHYALPYRYPPLLAGALSHLLFIPYRTLLLLWMLASVAALGVAGVALSRMLSGRAIDPLVFGALAGFVPATNTIYTGQAEAFVLAGVALLITSPPLRGAAVFGASLVVKPVAAPVAALLVWRGDIARSAAAIAGGVAAFLAALILAGPATLGAYVANALRLSTIEVAGVEAHPNNVSMFAEFERLTGADPMTSRSLALAAAAVFVVIVALLARRAPLPQATALVVTATLLAAPMAWYHDVTVAFVSFAVAWSNGGRRMRAALVASYLLLAAHGLLWRNVAAAVPQVDLATLGLLVLLGVNVVSAAGVAPRPVPTSSRSDGDSPRTAGRIQPAA